MAFQRSARAGRRTTALQRSVRAGRRSVWLLFAAVALTATAALTAAALKASSVLAFTAAPPRPTPAALAAAVAVAPLSALADLPPLEDEAATVIQSNQGTFMGLPLGPLLIVGFVLAIAYAFTVVANVDLEDKGYKTYFGGGDLPPVGYTNPLDPRMELLEAADEDDPLYEGEGGKKKEKPKQQS